MHIGFYEELDNRFSAELGIMTKTLASVLPTAKQYSDPDLNKSKPKLEGGPWDYVGMADLECQRLIIRMLLKDYPECKIIVEEVEGMEEFEHLLLQPTDNVTDYEHVFVIDPIDGSELFARGASLWSMMVQWIQKGKPIACVVVCPGMNGISVAAGQLGKGTIFSEHLLESLTTMESAEVKEGKILSPHNQWTKERNEGAINESPRPSVSFCQSLTIESRFWKFLQNFAPQVSPDMVISSGVALTLVACGKTCAMVHRPLPWYDLAAIVLVQAIPNSKVVLWEFDDKGKPTLVTKPNFFGQTGYIAGNPEVVEWLTKLLFESFEASVPTPAMFYNLAVAN